MKKTILLLCGGGGTEHEISLVSAKYLEKNILDSGLYQLIKVEIGKDHIWRKDHTEVCELRFDKKLYFNNVAQHIDYVIPCIHGPPGETGEIQAYFEMIKLPYLGCGPEASMICFNKVTSKLWFDSLGIPNTPFAYLTRPSEIDKALALFDQFGSIFVKAASQGSSVGCYQVFKREELAAIIKKAFDYSPFVLVEKMVNARELEISVYEFNGEIKTTVPGEIKCPSKFYSYEEKYDPNSKTTTEIVAPGLDEKTIQSMREYALRAFQGLKLRHLSRIDFFYTDKGEIYLNEINTFPGMTPISMFPKMMENNGDQFFIFLNQIIKQNI